jgi:transposase
MAGDVPDDGLVVVGFAVHVPRSTPVPLRSTGLVQVQVDDDLVVMGMLADRRDELGRARTQTASRLHRLLLELFPGGAKQSLSAQQARAMIATIRPRDLPGKTRRLAAELISELEAIGKKIKAIKKELTALVTARGSTLLELHGIGPSSASLAGTSSRPGTAPRRWMPPLGTRNATVCRGAGNRRINRALHIMAVVQLRNQTPGWFYYDARKAGGMPSMMAIRALKRRLSNVVFARMLADLRRREAAGPGGQPGTTTDSSVTDLTRTSALRRSHLPGPPPSLERSSRQSLNIKGCQIRAPRERRAT